MEDEYGIVLIELADARADLEQAKDAKESAQGMMNAARLRIISLTRQLENEGVIEKHIPFFYEEPEGSWEDE